MRNQQQCIMMEYEFDLEAYLNKFPSVQRELLSNVAKTIEEYLPADAQGKWSYGMPSYYYKKYIIHFAGYAKHWSIYPGAKAIEVLQSELLGYEISKGTIRIPWTKEIPDQLIKKMIHFNLGQLK